MDNKRLLLGLVLPLFLLGCREAAEPAPTPGLTPEGAVTAVAAPEEGYPAPAYPGDQQGSESYPGAVEAEGESAAIDSGLPTLDPNRPVPTPEPGIATVTGLVLSESGGGPIGGVPVFLAEIYRNPEGQGAMALDTASSPTTYTDERGRFIFSGIRPGEYAIVVGYLELNNYVIIPDAAGDARVLEVPADQIVEIGELTVALE